MPPEIHPPDSDKQYAVVMKALDTVMRADRLPSSCRTLFCGLSSSLQAFEWHDEFQRIFGADLHTAIVNVGPSTRRRPGAGTAWIIFITPEVAMHHFGQYHRHNFHGSELDISFHNDLGVFLNAQADRAMEALLQEEKPDASAPSKAKAPKAPMQSRSAAKLSTQKPPLAPSSTNSRHFTSSSKHFEGMSR